MVTVTFHTCVIKPIILIYLTSIQRPRKVGAKFTGEKLAPDEYYQPNLSFDYDGKRDRWNGYDLDNHQAVLEEYTKIEEVCMEYELIITLINFRHECDIRAQ